LLSGQKVIPVSLDELSFHFDFPDLELALSHCLGKY
jgi:NAD dependent epimerase/dehydratase family enzyme